MLNIFRRKGTVSSAFLPITTDIHSHILPGIDDGSQDMATSLQLIKGLYDLGIRKCIATPHIIGDLYRNTPHTIGVALAKTKLACAEAGIDMELAAAAEYMLDDHFMELLQQKEALLTLHENIILTEFSYTLRPANIEEMIFNIITGGYQPVLAHPERYFYLHRDFEQYRRLKDLGFLLQVNLLSLTGYYGKDVSRAAKYILDKGLADHVGTDLHHSRHLSALQDPGHLAVFARHIGKRAFNIF